MIHLDTHVVVWLYGDRADRFSARGRELIEREATAISPMVLLELALLHEIGRVVDPPDVVLATVRAGLDLPLTTTPFSVIVTSALGLSWTRDPFDRIILATALAEGVPLLTRDRLLRERAPEAVWG